MSDASRDHEAEARRLEETLARREAELAALEAEVAAFQDRLEGESPGTSSAEAGVDDEIRRLLDVHEGEQASAERLRAAGPEIWTSPPSRREERVEVLVEQSVGMGRRLDHLRVLVENLDRKVEVLAEVALREMRARSAPRLARSGGRRLARLGIVALAVAATLALWIWLGLGRG